MKKQIKLFIYLLIALPVLFAGCKKSELNDDSIKSVAKPTGGVVRATSAPVYCGEQLVVDLYDSHEPTGGVMHGKLTVGNDATSLYLTYTLNAGSEYFINGLSFYVGPESGLPAAPDGYYNFTTIPSSWPNKWFTEGVKTFTAVLGLDTLPDCFTIVAFARISKNTNIITNDPTAVYITARPNASPSTGLKNHYGHYLNYCPEYCTCETAYAFGGNGVATCFLDLTGFPLSANNWGWTNYINGPIESIKWPVYAAAGQCDMTKGTLVGYLEGSYVGGTYSNGKYINGKLSLAYNLNSPFTLSVTHLYIGTTELPVKNGKWVTSPGQFSGTVPVVNKVISSPFYIAAHAEVCGPY